MINNDKFIGSRIGNVTITKFHSRKRSGIRLVYFYECLCDCGNKEIVSRDSLLVSKRNNTARSCYTCRKDKLMDWAKNATVIKYIDPIEGKCSILLSNYRSRAKSKKLDFKLTFEQFKNLVMNNCYYCDLEPNKCRQERAKSRMGMSRIYFNGIDRIDSNKGYIIDNCVPCCEDCNKAKRNLSKHDFLILVKGIYEHLNLANYHDDFAHFSKFEYELLKDILNSRCAIVINKAKEAGWIKINDDGFIEPDMERGEFDDKLSQIGLYMDWNIK